MRYALILALVPALLCAQVYIEAIGQTLPFTLAAGNHSNWDPTVANEKDLSLHLAAPAMTLYPNPARSAIVITVQGKGTVDLFTVAGKKVRSLAFAGGKTSVTANNLANGVYFARLSMKGRAVHTSRFLVVR